MSRYRKGYRLERRVEQLYSQYGWLATRFPKSGRRFYPADVLAIKRLGSQAVIHLIECKNLSKKDQGKKAIYINREHIHTLMDTAKQHQALALVAYSFPHQHAHILEAKGLKRSGKMFLVERRDGIPLYRFLKRLDQKMAPEIV